MLGILISIKENISNILTTIGNTPCKIYAPFESIEPEVKTVECEGTFIPNKLFAAAIADGCEYIYYIGNYNCVFNTNGWGAHLLAKARENINGIHGLIDLNCTEIFTQVCVHASHSHTFGFLFPSGLSDLQAFNWIAEVYKNAGYRVIVEYSVHSLQKSGESYSQPIELIKQYKRLLLDARGLAQPYSCTLPVYVLNLTRNYERREHMAKLGYTHGIDMQFLNALNGWKLQKAEKFTCCNRHKERIPDFIRPEMEYVQITIGKQWYLFNSNLTKGEVGLAITTITMYTQMIEKGIQWILVLEDDVKLHDEFLAHLKIIEGDLKALQEQGVDFVYLNDKMTGLSSDHIIEGRYMPIYRGCCFSGYLISISGARKLLDIYNPLIFPIDLQSTAHASIYEKYPQYKYREINMAKPYARINMYKYRTTLVTQSPEFRSSIHGFCPYHAV